MDEQLVDGSGSKDCDKWGYIRMAASHQQALQGFVKGPVLFSVFINDLDSALEFTLSKFASDTELGRAIDLLEDTETLQRDLDRLEVQAVTDCLKFNKRKCQILHPEWGNLLSVYRLGDERPECSPTERDLGDSG